MKAEFYYNKRKYVCGVFTNESSQELRIRNDKGEILAIEQGGKFGLQGKRRDNSKRVDVSQPYLYNLIKAAVSALEVADKTHLLGEKDKVIDSKNEQIENLIQQLNILNTTRILSVEQEEKLTQLKNDLEEKEVLIEVQKQQITRLEVDLKQTAPQPSENIEKRIIAKLGKSVWSCLHQSSQRELCSAYKNYSLIKSEQFTAFVADYSEAGHILGVVAEREIVAPFFKELYLFLSANQVNNSVDTCLEVAGIVLRARGRYTLGDLPALLSTQWETFTENALLQESCTPEDKLHRLVFANQVSQSDRQMIEQFIQQWQHPASRWLAKGQVAASTVDKIRKLRNRASHTEILYLWQFNRLWSLIVGHKTTRGVLQEIYDQRNEG